MSSLVRTLQKRMPTHPLVAVLDPRPHKEDVVITHHHKVLKSQLCFTRNPETGARETIMSAADGKARYPMLGPIFDLFETRRKEAA